MCWPRELVNRWFRWVDALTRYTYSYIHVPVTKHDFLYFLSEARKFYGSWPDPTTLYENLRINTPEGQARWDQQVRALIPRLLKRGLICWMPCEEVTKRVRAGSKRCGKPHLALTKLGEVQLATWNEMGCEAHTHTANCHASEREFDFQKKSVA
jgi:hypothetical protein